MKIALLILVYILYVYILNNIVWVGVYVLKYSIRGVYNKISSFRINNENNDNKNSENENENEKKNKERKLLKNKYEIIESDIENNIKKKHKNNIPMKNMEMI